MKDLATMLTTDIARILALSLALAACGKSHENRRGPHGEEYTGDAVQTTTPTPSPATPTLPPTPNTGGGTDDPSPPDIPTPPAFDESTLRATSVHYYQWDTRLADLFSPVNATSQLCWPASLASEFEYLRTRIAAPVSQLPEIATGADKTATETRHFTTLCNTDKTAGTTVIQGVKCIDDYLKSAQLTADVEVSGVDAFWGTLGFYPAGTTSTEGPISPARLRAATAADASVLLLIGFYAKDANGAYKRSRGHFVTVGGFDYMNAWAEDRLSLRILNPAETPTGTTPEALFETVELKRLEADVALPKDVGFELMGRGFGDDGAKAFVESTIEFTVRP